MADRKQFLRNVDSDPELAQILERTKGIVVGEEELKEQRISFAYGNAPQSSELRITKESIKATSEHIKLLPYTAVSVKCQLEKKTIRFSTQKSKNRIFSANTTSYQTA